MKKILQVMTIMNRGGAETMVMSYYRALDKSRYQFDFLVHRQERGAYEDEIERMGGRIIRAMPIRPGNYFRYFKFLDDFFREHADEYIAIHAHIQENSGFAFKYAAKYGIRNRLSTSHIAGVSYDLKYPFRLYAQMYLKKYVTVRLSCGKDAGRAMYGRKPFIVMQNAVDTAAFAFNKETSIEVRKEFGLGNSLVIGNTSRVCHRKNHLFMVEILAEMLKIRPDTKMVFLGENSEKNMLTSVIDRYNLQDHILFLGARGDVNRIVQAYDVFLFPSLREGLPVAVVEAQAAGLQCFLSDTIDRQTDITGDVTFLSLSLSAAQWAELILAGVPYPRHDNCKKLIDAGYDVHHNIERLLSLYIAQ